MKTKRIVWITADYFLDVDKAIVPYLRDTLKLNIKWYVFCGLNSKVEIPRDIIDKVFQLSNRNRNPKNFMEYYSIFKQMNVDKVRSLYY